MLILIMKIIANYCKWVSTDSAYLHYFPIRLPRSVKEEFTFKFMFRSDAQLSHLFENVKHKKASNASPADDCKKTHNVPCETEGCFGRPTRQNAVPFK